VGVCFNYATVGSCEGEAPGLADENSEGPGASKDSDDELDNEGNDELYRIHLVEYEMPQIKKFYHANLRQLRPGWEAQVEASTLQIDFLGAVMRFPEGFYTKRAVKWVDSVERGELSEVDRCATEWVGGSTSNQDYTIKHFV
jgi:hypothetical protein